MTTAPRLLLEAPSATQIGAAVANGDLDPRAIGADHLRRLHRVDPALNAVAWWVQDPEPASPPHGALAGVPVSIKGQFLLAGTPSTLGLVGRREHRAAGDGPPVARLRRAVRSRW